MTDKENENIGLRIEPGTPENVTELENIEQEDETDIQIRTVDQTDIQMHNLKNKIINLCGKMYSLKQRKEKKKKKKRKLASRGGKRA